MILVDVVAELAVALRYIPGLEVVEYLPKQVTPPTAILPFPDDGEFDGTYARGMDTMTLPIIVVMSDIFGEQAMREMSDYTAGEGPKSIKQLVDGIENPRAFDIAQVGGYEVDQLTFNRVEYIAAIFNCEITGSGEQS